MSNKTGRNASCWCGSQKKYKNCHAGFDRKLAELEQAGHEIPPREIIKTPAQIEKIRASARVNIAVLDFITTNIRLGMSTEEIDCLVYQKTTELGGLPATLNYEGFPKSVCTSLNEEICHGIPAPDVILKEGDIINVDVSTILDGYFSDSSRMFCLGNVPEEKNRLVQVTKECVEQGLRQIKPWGFLGDMAQAINDCATKNGYSVVREFGGHGIGLAFHEDPWVSHIGEKGSGMVLAPGMIFTIEPMINMGSCELEIDDKNHWTAYTKDRKPSAQWEIMVLVTETGHEVLAY